MASLRTWLTKLAGQQACCPASPANNQDFVPALDWFESQLTVPGRAVDWI